MGKNFRISPSRVLPFHYKVLEVDKHASPAVIEAAYKALQRRFHPNVPGKPKNADEDEHSKRIIEAYEVLSDESRRTAYDRELNQKPSGTILGNYELIEPIAEGGFGVTYLARHVISRALACVKDCSNVEATYAPMLIEEYNSVQGLAHYALPAMKDLIELEDGGYALVMSYIPGPTLAQMIEKVLKKGKLPNPECVAWVMERMLNVLCYMHKHGVIHGDIKPQNIILQDEKHIACLVDFGLSVVKPTLASRSKGYTPFFSPPEALAGTPLLPQSDLFSLAMTMIFALTGEIKPLGSNRLPDSVPEPFEEFIGSFLKKDVMTRANWNTSNLLEEIKKVRKASFGREESHMIRFLD